MVVAIKTSLSKGASFRAICDLYLQFMASAGTYHTYFAWAAQNGVALRWGCLKNPHGSEDVFMVVPDDDDGALLLMRFPELRKRLASPFETDRIAKDDGVAA